MEKGRLICTLLVIGFVFGQTGIFVALNESIFVQVYPRKNLSQRFDKQYVEGFIVPRLFSFDDLHKDLVENSSISSNMFPSIAQEIKQEFSYTEEVILQDSFEDLDIWEVTNPSIMSLNTSFGNPAPSVEIISTQADLGLCKYEEVFFPPLEAGEFIRTAIDAYIPVGQTGSMSIFTDITGTKFPFRLRIFDTNRVHLYIYSTSQESTPSYDFIPQNWYEFAVEIYNDHFTLTVNGTKLTSIDSNAYQSKNVPIAFGDGAHSIPEQGHYFFDNIKVSKVENLPPSISLTTPVNNTIQKSGTTIALTIEDQNLDTAWYAWDEGTNQSFTTSWNVTLALPDGWHQLAVYANDTAGESTLRHYYFYCDTESPVIGLVGLGNDTLISSETTIRLNITDFSLQDVWVNWDDDVNQTLASPYEVPAPLTEGYHWLNVYANDSVGLLTGKKYRWWINLVPIISLLSSMVLLLL